MTLDIVKDLVITKDLKEVLKMKYSSENKGSGNAGEKCGRESRTDI